MRNLRMLTQITISLDVLANRMGLAHMLTFKCTSCNWEKSQYLSSRTKPKATGGISYFESNVAQVENMELLELYEILELSEITHSEVSVIS